MNLYEAIQHHNDHHYKGMVKYLSLSGINDWCDLTKVNLSHFKEVMSNHVSSGSVKTYTSILRAVIGIYEEDVQIPCQEYKKMLRASAEAPIKIALDPLEVDLIESLELTSPTELYVQKCFIIGARTGMRHSDIIQVTAEMINDGVLTYASEKTGIISQIPLSKRTISYIDYIQANDPKITLMSYNRIIRRLAEKAGITGMVAVKKGDKKLTKRKCDCISSHTARISFCSNLATLDVPIIDISRMSGHTNTAMTERYIVNRTPNLNELAMKYLK